MTEFTETSEYPIEIKQNVSLQPFNTMAVAATARSFTTIDNVSQLKSALAWAERRNLSVLVLGEGSNTIFQSDYLGLVILNRIKGVTVLSESDHEVLVKVGAGENWHHLVEYTVEQSWYGLENLALIPGLVGAAPIQNIGAYGVEVSQCLHSVDYIDIDSRVERQMTNKECQFAYRDSIFKSDLLDEVVITGVSFKFNKSASLNLSYPALRAYFEQLSIARPKQRDVFSAVCNIRSSKLPSPKDIPNAGSFFKNPLVSSAELEQLKQKFPDLVSYKANGAHKLAAAWLIENAGWKHREIDGIRVHQEQALVIINPKCLNGRAIVNLARSIQSDIKERYRVVLEVEPRLV